MRGGTGRLDRKPVPYPPPEGQGCQRELCVGDEGGGLLDGQGGGISIQDLPVLGGQGLREVWGEWGRQCSGIPHTWRQGPEGGGGKECVSAQECPTHGGKGLR